MKHKSKTLLNATRNLSTDAMTSSTVMQKFDINSMAGTESIAKATVMLPVYQRIRDDVRVNLTLTPSKVAKMAS